MVCQLHCCSLLFLPNLQLSRTLPLQETAANPGPGLCPVIVSSFCVSVLTSADRETSLKHLLPSPGSRRGRTWPEAQTSGGCVSIVPPWHPVRQQSRKRFRDACPPLISPNSSVIYGEKQNLIDAVVIPFFMCYN